MLSLLYGLYAFLHLAYKQRVPSERPRTSLAMGTAMAKRR